MTPQSQDELDKILWNFAMKIGATRDKVMVGADNLESTKQLLLAWRRTTSLPNKLVFEPKKNMACSLACSVKKPEELNPCPDCGGTRIYEWAEFVEKHGFTPYGINGFNQAIDLTKKNMEEL